MATRFLGGCGTIQPSAWYSATRAGSAFPNHHTPMRSFQDKSFVTTGNFPATRLVLAYRVITAVIVTEPTGVGCMRISRLQQEALPAPSKRLSTICRSEWFFVRRCGGTTDKPWHSKTLKNWKRCGIQ